MTETTILLADDDRLIVDVLSHQLQREGYTVIPAYDGAQALELAQSRRPDLVLLDVMMPKMQGWEVCREIRRDSTVPILMLSARGEEMDRVLGLEMGADDYIVKPFSFREVLARIRANLRRVSYAAPAGNGSEDTVTIGHITFDRKRHQVIRAGEPINLSQREYDLVMALLEAEGGVVARNDLLDQVWGEAWFGAPRTLDVHIRWCREKLEEDPSAPRLILTVRGVGYRLISPDEIEETTESP